jgi:hypothetical protein
MTVPITLELIYIHRIKSEQNAKKTSLEKVLFARDILKKLTYE